MPNSFALIAQAGGAVIFSLRFMRERQRIDARQWIRRQRLIDRDQHLLRRQLLETMTSTFNVALAAFEGARQAWQRILHEPNITTVLNRAARSPRWVQAPNRPGSPELSDPLVRREPPSGIQSPRLDG